MITNERQYRATKAAARIFEEALERTDDPMAQRSPRIYTALRNGVSGDLEMLRAELREYEEFRAGKIRTLTIEAFDEFPDILIRARIASGLTQRELAEELGIKEQQIQRYEATRYKSASFTRLAAVALVLNIKICLQATLPDAVEFRARLQEEDARIREMMQRVRGKAAPAEEETALAAFG